MSPPTDIAGGWRDVRAYLRSAGFRTVTWERLTLGIAAIHIATA